MNNKLTNKQKRILIILIIGLILIDQIIKIVANGVSIQPEKIFLKDNITYILISIIIIILLIRYILRNNSFIKMDSRIILSFAIAGATSNMIDRIFRGYIVNYINIPFFTSINLSYIYIIITWIGMAVILTKTHFENKKKKN